MQELHEGVCLGLVLRGRRDGDRVFDQDRCLRDHELDRLALLPGEQRLVLVGEEDVTAPRKECLKPLAGARRLGDDVLPQLAEVVDSLGRCLSGAQGAAVRGHDVPARAARGERVRRDHLNARLEQVVPGLQLLRVAVTYYEDDDRACDHALVLVLVPVLRHELLLDERRDVRLERECDDVGIETGYDGPALLARRAVGLGERDAVSCLGLLKGRDQLSVRLFRRRIGHERQLRVLRGARRQGRHGKAYEQR